MRHRRCRRLPSPLLHFSTGSPFGHHPRLRIVCPRWGQWVQAGRFLFSLPLHSLHFSTGSPFRHHPRLRMVCPRWGQWVRAGRFLFSLPLHFSTLHSPLLHGFTLRASPAVTHGVSPPGTVGAGWEVSLFSPSPLLHSPLSTSPRVHPSGITRGYAWCVPAGDSEWTMSLFLLLPRKTNSGEECVFS